MDDLKNKIRQWRVENPIDWLRFFAKEAQSLGDQHGIYGNIVSDNNIHTLEMVMLIPEIKLNHSRYGYDAEFRGTSVELKSSKGKAISTHRQMTLKKIDDYRNAGLIVAAHRNNSIYEIIYVPSGCQRLEEQYYSKWEREIRDMAQVAIEKLRVQDPDEIDKIMKKTFKNDPRLSYKFIREVGAILYSSQTELTAENKGIEYYTWEI